MDHVSPEVPSRQKSTPVNWKVVGAILIVAIVVVLALLFVPVTTVARELTVTSSSASTTSFSVPGPTWVTVHFDRHGMAGMMYWVDGPRGLVFNRSMAGSGMMGGSDSYSFWTWGGEFRCGAEYTGSSSGSMPVWVNATWGTI